MVEFLTRFWTKMRHVKPIDKIDGTEVVPVIHAISTRHIHVDQIINLALDRFRAVPLTAVPVMPAGTIVATMGPVPTGWLKCDGSTLPRAQYPELFKAIGTSHGAGDGNTTFQLPDIKTKLSPSNKPDATWIIAT